MGCRAAPYGVVLGCALPCGDELCGAVPSRAVRRTGLLADFYMSGLVRQYILQQYRGTPQQVFVRTQLLNHIKMFPAQLSSAIAQLDSAQRRTVPCCRALPCCAVLCSAGLRDAFFRTFRNATRWYAKYQEPGTDMYVYVVPIFRLSASLILSSLSVLLG